MSRLSLVLRSVFLLGFVVVMPLLALPTVARRLDALLYGDSKRLPEEEWNQSAPEAAPATEVAVATIEAPQLPPRPARGGASVPAPDSARPSPPELAETPIFPAAAPEAIVAGGRLPNEDRPSAEGRLVGAALPPASNPYDERAARQVDGIRQELERMGAAYVLLELLEGTGQYRFHCQMLVNADLPDTEAFAATADDPVTAACKVLSAVENWRASRDPSPR
jgi:hypothetical protein